VIEKPMGKDELNEMIASSPFNTWLGQRVTAVEENRIDIAVTWREEFIGGAKTRHVHGGIFTALINAAGCYVIATRLGYTVPTVDLRCDFLRPAQPGDLRVVATILKLGKTLGTADVSIFDLNDQLLAAGRGVYATGA
jgi:uncharacterized protein (TIGR00369 family)